jgi:hypothetical protein
MLLFFRSNNTDDSHLSASNNRDLEFGLIKTNIVIIINRRAKRKYNNERIISLIQTAETPQEIMNVLLEIEVFFIYICIHIYTYMYI